MIKHDFFEKMAKIANLGKVNAKFVYGKQFILIPFERDRRPFFNILSGLCHRIDQIYHIWKSPFGGLKLF